MQPLDWAAVALYSAAVLALGTWAGRKEKSLDDYFLGGRSMPWLAVTCSILASAASALTFIGVPGAAFAGDFHYLQLAFGDIAARVLIARLLLTAFYRAKVTTVYQFLGLRFGPATRLAATLLFIATRVLASAVRLAGCAIAISVFFDLSLHASIVLIMAVAMAYTVSGGIKAVIWTDVLQFALFMGGALLAFGWIVSALPGGFEQYLELGRAHGKFEVVRWSLDWNDPEGLLAGSLFGFFLTFAVFGTDQDLVQRMLTCKDAAESRRSIILSGVLAVPLNLVFLSVGAALFAYYSAFPDPEVARLAGAGRSDYVFPHFIRHVLPAGVRGLLVSGLLAMAMGSLDSAIGALASTAYVDLIAPFSPKRSEREAVRLSRWLVVLFSVALGLVATLFGHQPSILWFGLRIMGYTYGSLLGIFLLAVLTRTRGSDGGNVAAMATGVAAVLFLTGDLGPGALASLRARLLAPLGVQAVAWPWAIVLGTAWTFGAAALTRGKRAF